MLDLLILILLFLLNINRYNANKLVLKVETR